MKIDRNNISTRIERHKHVGKIYCTRSNFLFKVLGYDVTACKYTEYTVKELVLNAVQVDPLKLS